MDRAHPHESAFTSRRFLLLPEESAGVPGQRPRIRRYKLASIGRGPAMDGTAVAFARLSGEFGRLLRGG